MKRILRYVIYVPVLLSVMHSQVSFDITLEFCRQTQISSSTTTVCADSPDPKKQSDAHKRFHDLLICPSLCHVLITSGMPVDGMLFRPRRIQSDLQRSNPGRAPPCLS